MSFLLGPMRKHIPGHKALTDSNAIVRLNTPEKVYIPLVAFGKDAVDVLVQPGDEVKIGTKLAARNDHFYVPIFSSVSGKVLELVDLPYTWGPKKVKHVVIENDHQDQHEVYETLDISNASKDEIVEHIKQLGIVGCGGAGFPTFAKYSNVKQADYLIINAVECEPYLTCDYRNAKEYLEDIVYGTLALQKAGNVSKVKVAIKDDKKALIAKLKEAFHPYSDIEVVGVPNVYPMGWERTLVRQLTNKEYKQLPIEVGCIVNNSTTAIAVSRAFKYGFPITEKLVTVSGDGVKNPANVLATIGTKMSDVIAACGGVTSEEITLQAGGPMMGRTLLSADTVINATTNALTIHEYREYNAIPCLRCGTCNDHCPAGILPVMIMDAEQAKDVDRLIKLDANSCIECGMCSYVCPSKIEVTEAVRRAKRVLALRK